MRPMGKSTDTKSRRVTPPSPSYMSNDQFANYLSELRSNRMSRPGGARPQPSGARPAPGRSSLGRSSMGRPSLDAASSQAESQTSTLPRSQHVPSNAPSVSSRYSRSSMSGRDYYPAAASEPPKSTDVVVPTHTYMERGQRWMEKEEAFSLRDAMEEMDLRDAPKPAETDDDETRLHNAALDEAAELVWQHQNPGKVRQPDGPYRYRPHLRKNSYAHARAASIGRHGDDVAATGLARDAGSRSVSGSSSESGSWSRRSRPSMDSAGSRYRSYGSVGPSSRADPAAEPRRRSSMKRNISGEVDRPFSGDQIWEEPETGSAYGSVRTGRASPDKLASRVQNPLNRVRFENASTEELADKTPHNRVEIHRNPPSRTRDAQYTSNAGLPASPSQDSVERKNGVEVRGQDIRDATSMRLRDRSPRLPEPSAVSDSPGRPIVSFDADWRAPDESTDRKPDQKEIPPPSPSRTYPRPDLQSKPLPQPVGVPSISVEEDRTPRSRPSPDADIPTISVAGPDDASATRPLPTINVPTIAVEEPSAGGSANNNNIPTICLPGEEPDSSAQTPSGSQSGRTRPLPSQQHAQRSRAHWSRAPAPSGSSNARGLTICHECGFPIEGRFVALAGTSERFHPQCLRCFTCGTSLEAMEISPEPQQMRSERLERIQRRAAGEILDETPGMTMAEDGDDRLRFYCHLDWHEMFAPRCKHCETPILGEHIVALGQHWHYGHFFCAECGDPFEQGMTHIEKDGYAWCINCQTKRTERRAPKCRKCRTAVVGEYIQALGGEWHEHCFRCAECQGSFDDGQIFPKDLPGGLMVVLCTPCRARELKR